MLSKIQIPGIKEMVQQNRILPLYATDPGIMYSLLNPAGDPEWRDKTSLGVSLNKWEQNNKKLPYMSSR